MLRILHKLHKCWWRYCKSHTSARDATPVRTNRTLSAFLQAQSKRAALPEYRFLVATITVYITGHGCHGSAQNTLQSKAPHPLHDRFEIPNRILSLLVLDFMRKGQATPLAMEDSPKVTVIVQKLWIPHVREAGGHHVNNVTEARGSSFATAASFKACSDTCNTLGMPQHIATRLLSPGACEIKGVARTIILDLVQEHT